MTGQQLRNSILQEAIQGRLVPNVLQPGEKTGAELLQDILAERQKKAGTLTISTVEEGPWELPEGWCWCKFNDLFEVSGGSQPPKSNFVESPREGYVRLYQIRDYGPNPVPIYVPQNMVSKFTKKGDILIARYGGSLGKIFWAEEGAYNVAMAKSIPLYEGLSELKYQYYFYHTQLFRDAIFGASSRSAQAGFNKEDLDSLLYPLPPLSIQKAIVAKIEELLPLVDEYDKAAGELKALNETLPDKLRKSVLQEAIHGNLVPNDIPDGESTASELLQQILKERQDRENKEKGKKAKKLTLSTIEEEPWELPEGWCWCKLDDVGEFTRGNGIKKDEVIPVGYPCVRYGELYTRYKIQFSSITSHICESTYNKSQKIEKGDVVMALTGENEYDIALASVYLGDPPVAMGGDMTKLHPYIDSKYLVYAINSPYGIECKSVLATGQIIVHISNDKLASIQIPLPPLSIQHRIVEKIEELFSAINTL